MEEDAAKHAKLAALRRELAKLVQGGEDVEVDLKSLAPTLKRRMAWQSARATPEKVARKCDRGGIPNLGNSCYINSVLQCLASVHLDLHVDLAGGPLGLSRAARDLFKNLRGNGSVNPQPFKDALDEN
jgi:hypothetical protein